MKFGDIRIYDKNFGLLNIQPKYIAANWEINFKEFGCGEIQLEKTKEIVSLLTQNRYLFLFQDDIQSIITGYKIGETVTVFTRTLEWLLTKFCVTGFSVYELMNEVYNSTWSASRLVGYILEQNLHKDFKLRFLGINSDKSDMSDFSLQGASDLYSLIKSIIKDEKTGFKFYRDFNDGCFVFEMVLAKENTEFTLCDEYRNSYESEYNFDIQNEASGGVFYHAITNMGRWDASINSPVIEQKPSNYGKYYTVSADGKIMGEYVYKGQIILCKRTDGIFDIVEKAEPFLVEFPPEDNGIFSWTAVLDSTDTVSAENELSDKKAMDMITGKTSLSYPDEFHLGDIVSVKFFADDMSCSQKKLISQIYMWDEPEGSGINPTLTDVT
ncbi:MAG: hypothetical protein J6R66_02825 [Clostridia bacterium]|nr:hypothetical protein [Clostridia bacterium]